VRFLLASYKAKVAVVTFALFIATFFLDYLIFEKVLFSIPNEMEWDTSHWYNFAYARKQIKEPTTGKKVILAGSSVALYSVLPGELFGGSTQDINSQFYSHVAMAPTDLYYYKEDISKSKPDLVIYILNFADLQWEYVSVQNDNYVFNHKLWLDEYSDRYPARTYYPFQFLIDYFSELNKKQILRLSSKAMLYVNRYRHFFFDPLETWIDNHFRSGRSFQKYHGSPPKEGIWSKGWTEKFATLECTLPRGKEDSIFTLKANTEISVSIFKDGDSIENPLATTKIIFNKSGWNRFPWEQIPNHQDLSKFLIKLEVTKGMGTAVEANLFHYGNDYPVGVRLSHYFCLEPVYDNKSYVRDAFLDEKRFTRMSSEEYDQDYYLRILDKAEDRHELGRLNTLRKRKKEIKNVPFKPWFEYNQLLKISNFFKSQNIPFTIVMSPENPLESSEYVKERWFGGFIKDLESRLGENNHKLYDYTNLLDKKQFFFDPHHLTYDGAKSFNPFIESVIQKEIRGNRNE